MHEQKARTGAGSSDAKRVVHARVGTTGAETLEALARREGVSLTQALRNLLDEAKERMAEYLVLDAVIGNTDRHHENWGILRKRMPKGWTGMVAPSFDHASSLGRELLDEGPGRSRQRILAEGRIGQYAEKAPGAIYWDWTDRRGVSPLELVRRGAEAHPETFTRALQMLDKLKEEDLRGIVGRVPAGWMSETSRIFVVELTCYNLKQLRMIAL